MEIPPGRGGAKIWNSYYFDLHLVGAHQCGIKRMLPDTVPASTKDKDSKRWCVCLVVQISKLFKGERCFNIYKLELFSPLIQFRGSMIHANLPLCFILALVYMLVGKLLVFEQSTQIRLSFFLKFLTRLDRLVKEPFSLVI